ncbi:MAG: DNA-3-methyladenine glycosylase, partial [Candidatus Dormiibacterota bacterium]
ATVRRRRAGHSRREPEVAGLLRGPGNVGSGLGLGPPDNGLDLCDPGSRLSILEAATRPELAVGRRVGITRAAEQPLRFAWLGHPAVSRPAPWA